MSKDKVEEKEKQEDTRSIVPMKGKRTSKIHYCPTEDSDDSDGTSLILSQGKLHSKSNSNESDKGKLLQM